MGKQIWRPGNMLYPLPVVLISARNKEGKDNLCTVAWTGTVCSDPAMVSISLRESRLTYEYVKETGVFVINLTTRDLVRATDYCGVRSGRGEDKFASMGLGKEEAEKISCPMVAESPVNIECRVKDAVPLGTHVMFTAEVLAVHADEAYMDGEGRFCFEKSDPIVYSHGRYYTLGEELGSFGYSVKKKS